MKHTFKMKTRDGMSLYVDEYQSEKEPRAVLLIIHGMAEHKERYKNFAAFMAERNISVYVYDQRGCGSSQLPSMPKGMLSLQNGWELLLEDANQMVGLLASKHDGLPLFVLGHSMGSLVMRCAAMMTGDKLSGLILSGTAKNPGISGSFGKMLAVFLHTFSHSRKPSQLMDRLLFARNNERFEPARTSFDWLSRDEKVVDDYVADPDCGFVCPPSFYLELIKGAQLAWKQETFLRTPKNLPILLLGGDEDPVGDYGVAAEQVRQAFLDAGVREVNVKLFAGGRHEMLNEINKDEVYRFVESWMNEKMIAGSHQ